MVEESLLDITASIGFNYSRQNCICVHPSDMHFLWAQGCLLIIKSIGVEDNAYLKGHTGKISMIACSSSGDLIASGETCHQNSQAAVIVWDFKERKMRFRVRHHTTQVQNLAFNCDESFLISVGGPDDRNKLICWNLHEGRSEAAQPASELNNQETTTVQFYNHQSDKFITGHNNGVKFQRIDTKSGKF